MEQYNNQNPFDPSNPTNPSYTSLPRGQSLIPSEELGSLEVILRIIRAIKIIRVILAFKLSGKLKYFFERERLRYLRTGVLRGIL